MGYVDLHKLLNHQGIPNCIESQFQIPTESNIPLWEKLLHRNRDHQLIYFLKYGFPFDVLVTEIRTQHCCQKSQYSLTAYSMHC